MINVFITNALVNEADINQALAVKFAIAVKAGAEVGQKAHQKIVDDWSHQPAIDIDGPKVDAGITSADVVITDSGDSWWEAINFGSTSPGVSHTLMTIGPYDAFSQPGDPFAGPGEKSYDGLVYERRPTTIAPRDFIGHVVNEKQQEIIDAVTQALS